MVMYAKISHPFPAMTIHRSIFHQGWSELIQHHPEETKSPEYPGASFPLAIAVIAKGIPQPVKWNHSIIRLSESTDIFLLITR